MKRLFKNIRNKRRNKKALFNLVDKNIKSTEKQEIQIKKEYIEHFITK